MNAYTSRPDDHEYWEKRGAAEAHAEAQDRAERAEGEVAQLREDLARVQGVGHKYLDRAERAEAELAVADKLILERNRVLDVLPCPQHGQCVSHALEEIARLRKVANAALAWHDAPMTERPGLALALMDACADARADGLLPSVTL